MPPDPSSTASKIGVGKKWAALYSIHQELQACLQGDTNLIPLLGSARDVDLVRSLFVREQVQIVLRCGLACSLVKPIRCLAWLIMLARRALFVKLR